MPPVLHSLNSLRVLAEFCVVHVHLADNFGSQYGWLPNTFVKEDVMSFFFVLSGFVTAYSHAGEEPRDRLEYLGRRVGKMLPPFLLSCLLDLPGAAITQYRAGCDLFWPASALQLFLLSPWTGLSHIARLTACVLVPGVPGLAVDGLCVFEDGPAISGLASGGRAVRAVLAAVLAARSGARIAVERGALRGPPAWPLGGLQ